MTGSGSKQETIYFYGTGSSNIVITNSDMIGGRGWNISNIQNLILTSDSQASGTAYSFYIHDSVTGLVLVDEITSTNHSGANAAIWLLNGAYTAGSYLKNSSVTGSNGAGSIYLDGISNLDVSDTSVTNSTGTGFLVRNTSHDITFTNCTSTNSTSYGFWAQNGSYNVAYDHCRATGGGSDGFGVIDSSGVSHDITYNYCISDNNGNKASTSDGDGFTSHLNNYNIFFNYCISYNNTSAGYAMWGTSSGHIYNSIAHNNAGNWSLEGGGKLDQVRGGFAFSLSGSNPTVGTGWSVKNSIGSNNYPREIRQSSGDHTNHWSIFDYNLYNPADINRFASIDDGVTNNDINYSNWIGYGIDDEHGPENSNPLFINTAISNFQLQSTSPAIDAGTDVSLTSDYAGNPIYGAPDIGAYEYQPPHTMGDDEVTTSAAVRVYGDEKFRNKTAPAGGTTADLSITIPDTDRTEWLDAEISVWNNTGTRKKTWTESSSVSGLTNTVHTIGDLDANKYYNVSVDDTLGQNIQGDDCTNGICKANAQGKITFTYTGTYSEHEFNVEEKTTSSAKAEKPKIEIKNQDDKKVKKDKTIETKEERMTLKGEDQDLASGTIKIYKNNKLWKTITATASGVWKKTLKLGDSFSGWIKVRQYDKYGILLSTDKAKIEVDNEKPKFTSFDLPWRATREITKLTWEAKDNENVKKYKIYLGGRIYQTKFNSFQIPREVPTGLQKIKVRVYDEVGNTNIKEGYIWVK